MNTYAVPLNSVPPSLHAWIQLPGSMTQAIQAVTGRVPTVSVQISDCARASNWEAQLLHGEACYVRHIELSAGELLCLKARSLALQNTYPARALEKLGDRPLADLLFQGDWRQGEIQAVRAESCQMSCDHPDRGVAQFGRAAVWYSHTDQPLLVQEIFSSEFVERFQPQAGATPVSCS